MPELNNSSSSSEFCHTNAQVLPSFNLKSSSAHISGRIGRSLRCPLVLQHLNASSRGCTSLLPSGAFNCPCRCSRSVTSAASGGTLSRHSTVGSLHFSRPVFFLSSSLFKSSNSIPSRVLRAVKGPYSVCASYSPANSQLPGESLPGGVFRGLMLGPKLARGEQ